MITTQKLKRFDRDWYYLPTKGTHLHYLSKHRVDDATIDQFCDWVLQWCERKFGTHQRKDVPELEWDWNDRWYQKNNFLGFYDKEDNLITLRIQGHRTVNNLAKTIIHEYIHYLQWSHKRYEEADAKLGYSNNPYEIEAEYLSDLYYAECVMAVLGWME